MSNFEAKHPRATDGKFTEKNRKESGLTLELEERLEDLDIPRVFVDCVDCRRKGVTTGKWVKVTDTEGLKPVDICLDREHETLEVSDTDGGLEIAPRTVEEASRWGEVYSKAKEDGHEKAFKAWVNECGITDPKDALKFDDAFVGEYDSWEIFASDFAHQTGVVDNQVLYFDYDRFASDLELNCEVEKTADGVAIRNFDDDPDGKVVVKADSFEDYARDLAQETIIKPESVEQLDVYCDYEALGEELKGAYSSADSEFGVYVFQNI